MTYSPCFPSGLLPVTRALLLTCLILLLPTNALQAADAAVKPFDIPSGAASRTLKLFAQQSGREIVFSAEDIGETQTNSVRGELAAPEALNRMVAGTGLTVGVEEKSGLFSVRREAGKNARSGVGRSTPPGVGELSGYVSHGVTRASLAGAVVEIAGSGRRVLADTTGYFRFTNLPPGTYRVTVSYPGLDSDTTTTSVGPGDNSKVTFALSSEIYRLEAFTVASDREGNAASLTRQRNANNIINVVSLDAYGDVADGNVGNFLQKLPGVATQMADGDIVGVMLRGAPPGMSMISLDGTQMSAAGSRDSIPGSDRAPVIDRIPAEFIKEVEVTKASTPDMDATGLGGAAKLVTKSAFDFRERQVFSYQWSYIRNTYRDEYPWTPSVSATLMRKFGPGDRMAVTLSGSYNDSFVGRDRIQMAKNNAEGFSTNFRMLDDIYHVIRRGAGGKLEFRPDESSSIYFDTLFTRYTRNNTRRDQQATSSGATRIADYGIVSRAAIQGGAVPRATATLAAGLAPGASTSAVELLNANFLSTSSTEWRENTQWLFALGGKKRWGNTEVIGRLTHGIDDFYKISPIFAARINGGTGFIIDQSRSQERPRFFQTYGPDPGNFAPYVQWQHTQSISDALERISTAGADVKHEVNRFPFPVHLQAGLKYQRQSRSTDIYRPIRDYVGADGVFGRNLATGTNDDNLPQFQQPSRYALFNGYYPAIPQINYTAIQGLFRTQPSHFRPNGTSVTVHPPPNRAIEEVAAAYAMGRIEIGRLTALGGLRVEETTVNAAGAVTQGANISRVSKSGSYAKLFPSLHLRHQPWRQLALRTSYSTTTSRPNVSDITPITTIVSSASSAAAGTITQGNANLGPQTSRNYDVMLEYYLKPVGVLSAGIYRKDIRGFIASQRSIIGAGPDNGFSGNFAGYDFITKMNLNSARMEGYELAYDQQLRMLPKPLNTLAVFANYTRVRTAGTYEEGASALPSFVPEMYNFGASYSFWRLQVRVSYNYTGAFLFSYNANPLNQAYQSDGDSIDVNLQCKITPWLNASVNVQNLGNRWPGQYVGEPNRVTIAEVFGRRITVGIRGRF